MCITFQLSRIKYNLFINQGSPKLIVFKGCKTRLYRILNQNHFPCVPKGRKQRQSSHDVNNLPQYYCDKPDQRMITKHDQDVKRSSNYCRAHMAHIT